LTGDPKATSSSLDRDHPRILRNAAREELLNGRQTVDRLSGGQVKELLLTGAAASGAGVGSQAVFLCGGWRLGPAVVRPTRGSARCASRSGD
jgi:hypothetical protein